MELRVRPCLRGDAALHVGRAPRHADSTLDLRVRAAVRGARLAGVGGIPQEERTESV